MTTALLMDDNLMSATRIEGQLRRMEHQVRSARTLAEARPTGGELPQLILINLGSRSLNGVELIGALRGHYPQARIVGFCGHLEVDIRRAAKAAGIHQILTNEQAFSQLQQVL